jgi:MFS family permease
MVISLVVAGIQGQAPPALRGRVMGIYSIISQVIPAASGVMAGAVVRSAGITQAIFVAGVGLASMAVLAAVLMPQLRKTRS